MGLRNHLLRFLSKEGNLEGVFVGGIRPLALCGSGMGLRAVDRFSEGAPKIKDGLENSRGIRRRMKEAREGLQSEENGFFGWKKRGWNREEWLSKWMNPELPEACEQEVEIGAREGSEAKAGILTVRKSFQEGSPFLKLLKTCYFRGEQGFSNQNSSVSSKRIFFIESKFFRNDFSEKRFLSEEGAEKADGVFVGRLFFDLLAEETIDFIDVFESEVGVFVGAGFVFADPDQQFVFLVVGKHFTDLSDEFEMGAVDNVREDSADGGEDVDGGVVVLAREV